MNQRKIIHIDMDAFYASVEQLDNPAYRNKPIAVGGSSERGVVAAASYEARAFGIKSAMPSKQAAKLCPNLIFVKPRFERYKEVSAQIRAIFFRYTDLVEPLSLDEAFLDVTENKVNYTSASLLATRIREEIKAETGLTASAGISINKFTAKIASDVNKPNGQKTIAPEEVSAFLESLPVHRFFGIGAVTAKKMYALGIFTGKELKKQSDSFLVNEFGKSGHHYYNIVRGIQNSPVQPNRIRKSLAVEQTFTEDISRQQEILDKIHLITSELEKRAKKADSRGKTVTLKIKYNDFEQHTRSRTLDEFTSEAKTIHACAIDLLDQSPIIKPIRLLGISLSNLESDVSLNGTQLKLEF